MSVSKAKQGPGNSLRGPALPCPASFFQKEISRPSFPPRRVAQQAARHGTARHLCVARVARHWMKSGSYTYIMYVLQYTWSAATHPANPILLSPACCCPGDAVWCSSGAMRWQFLLWIGETTADFARVLARLFPCGDFRAVGGGYFVSDWATKPNR